MTHARPGGYVLGVDLGTTFTAAAIARGGRTEIVPLGDHAPQIPSAVFLTETGDYLIGDAAIRRGHLEPSRMATEFKRRLGDDTTIFLGSTPVSAQALMAELLAFVVAHVTAGQGEPPETVVMTHPANWGPYRRELLTHVAQIAAVPHATLCTEPEAAAVHFAATERVEVGETVAVYDLGGGTFDAAVLRKSSTEGFELLGTPEGIEHLGGLDFDAAVLHHVHEAVGTLDVDPNDPATLTGLIRLARDCTEAKEALSTDNNVTIPVTVSVTRTVRLSRPEFEEAIRPSLEATVAALQRAMDSADVGAEGLAAIVLIGGSSRIPLVTHLLTQHLGRPIALSAQPKHAVALGATLARADTPSTPPSPTVTVTSTPASGSASPSRAHSRNRTRLAVLVGAIAVSVALLITVLTVFDSSDQDSTSAKEGGTPIPPGPEEDGSVSETTSAPTPPATLTVQSNHDGYPALYEQYEALNPHITIESAVLDPSTNPDEALLGHLLDGSGAADIETVGGNWLTELMRYSDRFEDLSSSAVDGRWLDSTEIAATDQNGRLIAFGTTIGPLQVCYRADLLEEAGLPSQRDEVAELLGSTWEEYFAVGRQFVASSQAAWFDSVGGVWEGMYDQLEESYEDRAGNIIASSNPELRDRYDQLMGASTDGLSAGLPRSGSEWANALQGDEFATVICPAWMLADIEDGAAETSTWDIAPVSPGGAAVRGREYLVVPSQGEHVKEAQKLAEWLTEPEQQLALFEEDGGFPSQIDALDSAQLLGRTDTFFNDAPVGEMFSASAREATETHYRSAHNLEISRELHRALARVDIAGTDTADTSWDTFIAEVEQIE
ncbi:MAG: extracellular solute-binding protein [Ornithinimicrobium sp.]